MLSDNYKYIKEAYKYYAGVDPPRDVFCIGNNTFTEMINTECDGLVDKKTLNLADLDLEFVATNAGGANNNPMNPSKWLVRHNWSEIFVRIAITKYFKSGLTSSQSEAVKMIFKEFLTPFFSKYDSDKWR